MKKFGLVLLTLVTGLVGLGLRFWRFGFVLEPAGLLESGGAVTVVLTAWTVAVAAGLLLLIDREEPQPFAVGGIARLGQAIFCAYLIYSGVWMLLTTLDYLETVAAVLALVAAVCGLGVVAGWKGNHVPLCLYMVVLTISRFRVWSMDPQLANFSFQLLACVSMMLAVYHRAAFDMDMGKPKAWRIWSLLTAYLCIVAATDANRLFYIVSALWLLCGQIPGKSRPEQLPPEA